MLKVHNYLHGAVHLLCYLWNWTLVPAYNAIFSETDDSSLGSTQVVCERLSTMHYHIPVTRIFGAKFLECPHSSICGMLAWSTSLSKWKFGQDLALWIWVGLEYPSRSQKWKFGQDLFFICRASLSRATYLLTTVSVCLVGCLVAWLLVCMWISISIIDTRWLMMCLVCLTLWLFLVKFMAQKSLKLD